MVIPTARRPKKDAIAPRAKFASGPPSSAASRGRPPNPYAVPGMRDIEFWLSYQP